MASEQKKEDYQEYVRQNSPKTNLPLQMGKAFVMGGIICCLGQFIVNTAMNRFGIEKETAAGWCSVILILLSALFTGFNLYGKLVKWGAPARWYRLPDLPIRLLPRRLSTRRKGRYLVSDVKFLRLPDR